MYDFLKLLQEFFYGYYVEDWLVLPHTTFTVEFGLYPSLTIEKDTNQKIEVYLDPFTGYYIMTFPDGSYFALDTPHDEVITFKETVLGVVVELGT